MIIKKNSTWMIKIIYKLGWFINLDEELLDLGLDVQDLRLQIRGFVGGDGSRDDGARDTTGTTQGSLGGNKDVGDVLIFTQKRKMEENFQRLGIGYQKDTHVSLHIHNSSHLSLSSTVCHSLLTSHDNEFRDTSVKSLGSFVSTLLELLVVRCLLNQIEDGASQSGISEGESLGVNGSRLQSYMS